MIENAFWWESGTLNNNKVASAYLTVDDFAGDVDAIVVTNGEGTFEVAVDIEDMAWAIESDNGFTWDGFATSLYDAVEDINAIVGLVDIVGLDTTAGFRAIFNNADTKVSGALSDNFMVTFNTVEDNEQGSVYITNYDTDDGSWRVVVVTDDGDDIDKYGDPQNTYETEQEAYDAATDAVNQMVADGFATIISKTAEFHAILNGTSAEAPQPNYAIRIANLYKKVRADFGKAEGGFSGDDYKPGGVYEQIVDELVRRIAPIAEMITEEDIEWLEDQNYHGAVIACNKVLGNKTAEDSVDEYEFDDTFTNETSKEAQAMVSGENLKVGDIINFDFTTVMIVNTTSINQDSLAIYNDGSANSFESVSKNEVYEVVGHSDIWG